uniref:Uncharacterized protein n=1 Tax=Nonomuraea gerenzanensis TaxID=93944 RepID=A0A1M4BL80_9ACTN|nr:hypothetical protein BN4615_P10937 [Nonomuraea gerenzanensis]
MRRAPPPRAHPPVLLDVHPYDVRAPALLVAPVPGALPGLPRAWLVAGRACAGDSLAAAGADPGHLTQRDHPPGCHARSYVTFRDGDAE